MKSKIKKRSLNELRQSKDYNYKAPTSHKQAKAKNATICFGL